MEQKRKNFSVVFVNYSGDQPFIEKGKHVTTTDQELINWFLACKNSAAWQKISDITIIEDDGSNKPIDRTDLVMKIIKPRIFKEGEKVTPVYFNPLPGNKVSPDIYKDDTYIVKSITLDSKGNQHLDVGVVSKYEFIRSYETGEELPDGKKNSLVSSWTF